MIELIKILTCDDMGMTLSNLSGLGLHSTCKNKTIDDDEDDDESDDDMDSNADQNGSFEDYDNEQESHDIKVSDESKPGTSKSLHDQIEPEEPIRKKAKQEIVIEEKKNSINDQQSTSTCYVEVRRWKQGFYTLVTDDDHELQLNALDVNLFFNINDWNENCGGSVSYIARDEDDEVIFNLNSICIFNSNCIFSAFNC